MRLSFVTQLKIEFLLPFTGCRKVLGKMPECVLFTKQTESTESQPLIFDFFSFVTNHLLYHCMFYVMLYRLLFFRLIFCSFFLYFLDDLD